MLAMLTVGPSLLLLLLLPPSSVNLFPSCCETGHDVLSRRRSRIFYFPVALKSSRDCTHANVLGESFTLYFKYANIHSKYNCV
jgi:hypothetical protein